MPTPLPITASLQAGLTKARIALANEMYLFALNAISSDGQNVPANQRDWKIGATHSWHYVRNVEYRIQQLIQNLEILVPRKQKSGVAKNAFGGEYSFVRCELRTEDKKTAKVWIEENTANLGALLSDAIASDYKFSCSFSQDHDTFTASLTGKPDNAYNAFKTLTARHKDWQIAALTVLYKAVVMFRGGIWESDLDTDDDGWA